MCVGSSDWYVAHAVAPPGKVKRLSAHKWQAALTLHSPVSDMEALVCYSTRTLGNMGSLYYGILSTLFYGIIQESCSTGTIMQIAGVVRLQWQHLYLLSKSLTLGEARPSQLPSPCFPAASCIVFFLQASHASHSSVGTDSAADFPH